MNGKTITGIGLLVVGLILIAVYLPGMFQSMVKSDQARSRGRFGSRHATSLYDQEIYKAMPVIGVGSVITIGGIVFIILGIRDRKKTNN